MTTKQKAHTQEAAANAKFVVPYKTADMVSLTNQISTVVKGSPQWSNVNLQQSVTSWLGAADSIDKVEQAVKTTRLSLSGLIAQRAKGVTTWKRATKQVLADVDDVAAGSAQVITQLGFALTLRQPVAASSEAPTGLAVKYTKSLDLVLKWKAVKANRGYFIQIGDAAGQNWGPSLTSVKSTYTPQGLAPGAKVAFRVAVQRKGGMSAWSDALFVTVR
jgi:hypothetical protein